jgi:hypothetical protein
MRIKVTHPFEYKVGKDTAQAYAGNVYDVPEHVGLEAIASHKALRTSKEESKPESPLGVPPSPAEDKASRRRRKVT